MSQGSKWLTILLALVLAMGFALVLALIIPVISAGELRLLAALTGASVPWWLEYIGVMAMVFLAMSLLVLLSGLAWVRWRRPRIFISFKGMYQPQANVLSEQLQFQGFEVLMLPYKEGGYTHDEVVGGVRDLLRRADAVVTLPAPDLPSFVDAELLAASMAGLPITICHHHPTQKLPTTLLTGYAVLDYRDDWEGAATALDFAATVRFLRVVTRHPREAAYFVRRMFKLTFAPVATMVLLVLSLMPLLIQGGQWLVDWVSGLLQGAQGLPARDAEAAAFWYGYMPLLAAVVLLIALGRVLRLLWTAQQRLVTGRASFALFQEEFGVMPEDAVVLQRLVRNELATRGKPAPEAAKGI